MPIENQQFAPPADMVEYYRQVDTFIDAEVDQLRDLPFLKPAGTEPAIRFLSGDHSLSSLGLADVDSQHLAVNFRAMLDLLLTSAPDNPLAQALQRPSVAEHLAALPWSAPMATLERALSQWAGQEGLDEASLAQVLQWAASPFRRLAAERYADELRQLVTNEKATCPICGGYPDMAILDDNEHGRRYLYCLGCNWQWPFKRMGCGFCGNEDYGRLGYIVIEDLKGYKIYACEQCKSYLKTVDQRAGAPRLDRNPMLEHVKSLFLDLMAVDRGYLPMHA